MRRNAICDTSVANPWLLAERLADHLLDELLALVARELDSDCNAIVEQLAAEELS